MPPRAETRIERRFSSFKPFLQNKRAALDLPVDCLSNILGDVIIVTFVGWRTVVPRVCSWHSLFPRLCKQSRERQFQLSVNRVASSIKFEFSFQAHSKTHHGQHYHPLLKLNLSNIVHTYIIITIIGSDSIVIGNGIQTIFDYVHIITTTVLITIGWPNFFHTFLFPNSIVYYYY